jgi:hypothetical protein
MDNELPKKFKLISFYEEEWETSKKILLQLKKVCISNKISSEEKFEKLSSVIQIFESVNRFNQFNPEDIINLHTKKCIGLQKAIKTYFANNEEIFYTKLLPFIIEQSILLYDRANNKYKEQTIPLLISGYDMKEEIPKNLILSMLCNDFFCNHKDFVSQLNIKQKKLTHLEEWCNVDWYWLYSFENSVSVQRLICFLAYFDFAEKVFGLKNNFYFETNVIVERITFNRNTIINDISKCENTFNQNDINIHNKNGWMDINLEVNDGHNN